MCNPLLLMAAGTGVQTMGAYQQAQGAKAAYKYNAAVGAAQASDALTRGAEDVTRHRLQVAQLKSQQRTNLAANGVDLSVGSALDILTGTDILGKMDADMIRQNAEREAAGFRSGAALDRFSASQINPLMSAGTTLLGGAGQVASKWYDMKSVGAVS